MGIKFGEIDAGQILNNEFRIGVLEGILEWILNKNHNRRSTVNGTYCGVE